jgi:hypothetical protein
MQALTPSNMELYMPRIEGTISNNIVSRFQKKAVIQPVEKRIQPRREQDDAVTISLSSRSAPASANANPIAQQAINPAGHTRGWGRVISEPMPAPEPVVTPEGPRVHPQPTPRPTPPITPLPTPIQPQPTPTPTPPITPVPTPVQPDPIIRIQPTPPGPVVSAYKAVRGVEQREPLPEAAEARQSVEQTSGAAAQVRASVDLTA